MHQQDDFICMQAMFFESGWVKQLCCLLPLRRGLRKAHFYDSRSFINRWLTGYPRARYGKHFERSTAARCYWYASCRGSVTDLAGEGSRRGVWLHSKDRNAPVRSYQTLHTCCLSPPPASSPAVKPPCLLFDFSTQIIFIPLQLKLLSAKSLQEKSPGKNTPGTKWL